MGLKDYILKHIDQRVIYNKYLGISIEDINTSITKKSKIKNVYRNEKHPSVSFRYYGEKLIMRDFGDMSFRGDVFEIVGKVLNINSNTSEGFIEICRHIINNNQVSKSNSEIENKSIGEITDIEIYSREPTRFDLKLFKSYGIKENTVRDNIMVVSKFFINGRKMKYNYTLSDPCYAYVVNPNRLKLYFPNRLKTDTRFINNNRFPIECIYEIQHNPYLVLVKSFKDKLLLKQILNEKNIKDINILSLSSEVAKLTNDIMDLLRSYSKHIYCILDTDNTGFASASIYKENFNIIPIYFTIDYPQVKDPTDMVKMYGYNKVVETFIDIIKNQILKT